MKQCFKCSRHLPLSEFYAHSQMADGHLNKCKECTKADAKNVRMASAEYYRTYDRMRANDPKRIAARQAYATAKPDAGNEAKKVWEKKNPQKRSAHIQVSNAVRDGKLKKCPCENCGDKKVQAHHDDYSNPLDVRWLCVSCHANHHKMHRNLDASFVPRMASKRYQPGASGVV